VATNYEKEVVQVGDKIFVDDGHLSFTVLSRTDDGIRCIVDNSGYLGECKVIVILALTSNRESILPEGSWKIIYQL
jgi:pyruvate kinase